MCIDYFYPDPKTFLSIEEDSIKKATNCSALTKFGQLFSKLQGLRGQVKNSGLNFISHLDVEGPKGRKLKIMFGGLVNIDDDSNYKNTNYKVIIVDVEKEKIIKSIHYDFEPSVKRNRSEIKPSMHIQFGGELGPFQGYANNLGMDINENSYDSDSFGFEKTRIAFHPITLISLLNSIFLEFSHIEKIEAIVKDSTWKKTICELERRLLKKYYEHGGEVLDDSQNNNPLLYSYYDFL